MLTLSWFRSRSRSAHKRPAQQLRPTLEGLNDPMIVPGGTTHRRPPSFMPALEALEERLVPTSPHFVSAGDSITNAGALVANFKEAGLGANQNINYNLQATVTTTWAWVNKGNNVIEGQPFIVPPQTASATGTFSSGKNGNITASLTLTPQAPSPAEFPPPSSNPHLQLVLISASYTNVTLTDTTNNISVSLADQSVQLFQPKH